MFVYNTVRRNGQMDTVNPGDLIAFNEVIGANNTLTTAGAGTITGALFASSILRRTGPGANFNDTTDTADNIVQALLNSYYYVQGSNAPIGISPGTSYRLRYINTVAFVATLVAGAGVTLVNGNTAVAASSCKDYLITIVNGTPGKIMTNAVVTNASAVVTGLDPKQIGGITAGMNVSGTGIQAGTTVLSVQTNGVTLSLTANATNSGVSLTFTPAVTIQSLGQLLL